LIQPENFIFILIFFENYFGLCGLVLEISEQQKILRLQKPTPCFGKGISIRSSLFFITSEILKESEIKDQIFKKNEVIFEDFNCQKVRN
jgi:hypothetical protein